MKQITVLSFLLATIFCAHAQISDYDNQDFDHIVENNTNVILLNFRTLYISMRMSNRRFEELMDKYEYKYREDNYESNSPAGAPLYMFKKRPGNIQIMWFGDRTFCTYLKDQLDKLYIRTEDGMATYDVIDHDDPTFIDKFYLREDGNSGTVIFKREKEN